MTLSMIWLHPIKISRARCLEREHRAMEEKTKEYRSPVGTLMYLGAVLLFR